jgi:DNA primase
MTADYASLSIDLGIQGFIQGNELRARCPFHDDHNPSFSLNINTGLWICHRGCGSGEFYRLIELVLGCGPQEARDWAYSNGKRVSVEMLSKQLQQEMEKSVVEPVKNLYWRSHFYSLPTTVSPVWFLRRGFTWDTIEHWQIRYDPAYDAIVIPVFWEEELVGTITRHIRQDLPKYKNSEGLPSSKILFGEISRTKNDIILCEGVLDAIWLWQCGFNAGSLLGDILSKQQVEILKRYKFGEIIIALDNDEAGKKGTLEAIDKLMSAGYLLPQVKQIRFPVEPYKKDPQECSKDELEKLYNERTDVTNELFAT